MSPNKKTTKDWRDNDPDKETSERWKNNPKNWRFWGLIYFNKDDKRLFVPKRIEWMGTALNFANPKSVIPIVIALSFFSMVAFFILKKH